MKKLTHELTYPGAGLDEVSAMLGDPAFRERVCEAQRVLSKEVTITPAGTGRTVEIRQVQATSGVPGFARKVVGEETTLVQTERWTSPTAATVEVDLPGKPGEMTGGISLAETDGGVTETVTLDISVGIPLVGGKLEGLMADLMTKALKAENRVGRDWLAERR